MNKYTQLKEVCAAIILEFPVDEYDPSTDTTNIVVDLETVQKRDFTSRFTEEELANDFEEDELVTRRIGSANLYNCFEIIYSSCVPIISQIKESFSADMINESVSDIFSKIMQELKNDNIIRTTPEIVRQDSIKLIIDNTMKGEEIDREET